MLQVVGQEVHGHGRHGDVNLAAGRALLGHLAIQAAVGLFVAAEVGRGGVGLAALAASVALPGGFRGLVWAVLGGLAARAAVGDEEGVDGVAFADGGVAVDVTGG